MTRRHFLSLSPFLAFVNREEKPREVTIRRINLKEYQVYSADLNGHWFGVKTDTKEMALNVADLALTHDMV